MGKSWPKCARVLPSNGAAAESGIARERDLPSGVTGEALANDWLPKAANSTLATSVSGFVIS